MEMIMNERIQTLALECGAWQQVYDQQRFMHNHNFDIEKFAELIVKECITKVELRREFAIEDDHNVDEAFSLLIYDIESHFGVEE
jgi:hypothetical protein